MRNTRETKDGILIAMLEVHPKAAWTKKRTPEEGCFCAGGPACDCPLAPLAAIEDLARAGLVRLTPKKGYVLTEPKGLRAATLIWNRYAKREGKPELARALP